MTSEHCSINNDLRHHWEYSGARAQESRDEPIYMPGGNCRAGWTLSDKTRIKFLELPKEGGKALKKNYFIYVDAKYPLTELWGPIEERDRLVSIHRKTCDTALASSS